MKNNLFFPIALLGLTLLVSCTKQEEAPEPGAISGQITPAMSIATVTATDADSHNTSTKPTGSGQYSISQLTPGSYTLRFTPASNYLPPPDQSIVVKPGQTTTASPVASTRVTGSLTGSFYHAGSILTVTATDVDNRTWVVQPNALTYFFPELPVGLYTLTYTVDPDFYDLPAETVMVRTSGVQVTVQEASLRRNGSYTVNGTTIPVPIYLVNATYRNSTVVPDMLAVTCEDGIPSKTRVDLKLNNYVAGATGIFPFSPNTYPAAIFTETSPSGSVTTWYSASGSASITAAKDNPRRVSGTFSFVAVSSSGVANKTVTGSFNNVTY